MAQIRDTDLQPALSELVNRYRDGFALYQLPDIYGYQAETDPSFDPIEAITGFELMVYGILLCWQALTYILGSWWKNRFQV